MTQQWIGEQFVTSSKRPEEAGRTIKVLRQKEPAASLSFTVVNVGYPARPDLVGRETTMSAKTLASSAWSRVETASADVATPSLLDDLLTTIQAQHDEENPEEHSGCHTLVLLAGIRVVLAACDRATTGSVDPATIRAALAEGLHAELAPEALAHPAAHT